MLRNAVRFSTLRIIKEVRAMSSSSKKVFSFAGGKPSPSLRREAAKLLLPATEHRLKEEMASDADFLTYLGSGQGHPKYLNALAGFLSEEYGGEPVKTENLHLTAGATNGLLLALTLLVEKGAPVFTEEPLYFLAGGCIQECGMDLTPVLMDENGLALEDFEKKVKEYSEKHKWNETPLNKMYRGMVYLVPVFHNPTGKCYSPETCKGIIKIARKYNLLVLSEDVYNLLYYTIDSSPTRLLCYDKVSDPDYAGNVLSNGTFAKYYSPGIRVGWYEGPTKIINHMKQAKLTVGGGPVNNLGSGFMASFIELGLQRDFLKRLRSVYKNRMELFGKVLGENLPKSCSFFLPAGGFFIWVKLADDCDQKTVMDKMLSEYNIQAIHGARFSQLGGYHNYIRLSIAHIEDDEIEPGLLAFCECIKKYSHPAK